jgi:hypothetical protein
MWQSGNRQMLIMTYDLLDVSDINNYIDKHETRRPLSILQAEYRRCDDVVVQTVTVELSGSDYWKG